MGIKILFLFPYLTDVVKLFVTSTYLKLINHYDGNVLRLHLGPRVNAVISTAEGFEKVLSSNKQITKVKIDISLNNLAIW